MKLANAHILLISLFTTSIQVTQAQDSIWSLQKCIDTALLHNPQLEIQQNLLNISRDREKEAKAGWLPKIQIAGDYRYYNDLPYQLLPLTTFNANAPAGQFKEAQFGVPHTINANLNFSLPVYNANLIGGIKNSKLAGEMSEIQLEKSREQVIFDISNLYYNSQLIQHQIRFIDTNILSTKKLLITSELLHEQLMAKQTDVSKIALQLSQLETQRQILRNKKVQIINHLKLTMGVALNTDIETDLNIEIQVFKDSLPNNSKDIQIIEQQYKILSNDLKTIKRNKYLPNINLYGTYGKSGFGYSSTNNSFLNFYPMGYTGLQIVYPLFSGNIQQYKFKQKQLEIKNNQIQETLLQSQLDIQKLNILEQIETTKELVINSETQLQLAQNIYQQTSLQLQLGTANSTDVLLAGNAVREAQQNYLNAIVEVLKSQLELKKITGNLY